MPFLRTVVYTLVAVNVMITALLIGKEFVPVMTSIPSMGSKQIPSQQTIEYGMEKTGSRRSSKDGQGHWIVEHYKEYEYHYDDQGNVIEKRPTNKEEHLRYWQENKR